MVFILLVFQAFSVDHQEKTQRLYLLIGLQPFPFLNLVSYLSVMSERCGDSVCITQNSIAATRFFCTFSSLNCIYIRLLEYDKLHIYNVLKLNRLQLILNSSARAVSKSTKLCHFTSHLESLH